VSDRHLMRAIAVMVARHFRIHPRVLFPHVRKKGQLYSRRASLVRQIVVVLCRDCTDATLVDIGHTFGVTHSTVVWSRRKVRRIEREDEVLERDLLAMRMAIERFRECRR
jgi:chromosomal replication initiation ATPase DnaA